MGMLGPILGKGIDGDFLSSGNVTDAPIDAAMSAASAGATTVSATNASFAAGQKVLIVQMYGANAGFSEENYIAAYSAGTITLAAPLQNNYTGTIQILVVKQYNSYNIQAAHTITVKAWNGTTGGIFAIDVRGIFTVAGILLGTGQGYRGGLGSIHNFGGSNPSQYGEGTNGVAATASNTNPNGNGGGGTDGSGADGGPAGGGGSSINAGTAGGNGQGAGGQPGSVVGVTSASLLLLGGSGGGARGEKNGNGDGGNGGNGGAIIRINARDYVVTGSIANNGANGTNANPITSTDGAGSGAGGAGGTTRLIGYKFTLGSNLVTCLGGSPGTPGTPSAGTGGIGGNGNISIYTCATPSGISNPTFNNNGYQTYCGVVGRG